MTPVTVIATHEQLAAAAEGLGRSVYELTSPTKLTIERDHGAEIITGLSLLEQIRDDVQHNSGSSGRFVPASKPPLWVDGADLLARIEHQTRQDLARDSLTSLQRIDARQLGLARQLTTWASLAGRWRARRPSHLLAMAGTAARWLDEAQELVNPTRRWTHPGKCPECGTAIVYRRSDDEVVRNPALQVDPDTLTVVCLACRARWRGQQQLLMLGQVLELQQRETLSSVERERTEAR